MLLMICWLKVVVLIFFISIFLRPLIVYHITVYLSNKKAREGISRLRASAHHLEIERGRYSDIPRHERLCKSCLATGIHEVEDELHMLTTCIMSSKLRSELTTKAFLSQSGLHQLFNEANQENHLQSFKRLGSYITACFDERKIALDALTLSTTKV